MSQAPSTLPLPTSEPIVLPLDIILYMSKFLSFVDYRNFIQSICPNYDESDIFRPTLWRLSTHKITTKFLNGELMQIEYNYDPSREDRVLINLDSLLPVFGGFVLPAMDKFTSPSKLRNFIAMHVHLNMCSDRRYACCPCHLPNVDHHSAIAFERPSATACEYGHFHHYCSQHVSVWVRFFLNFFIECFEKEDALGEEVVRTVLRVLDSATYFRGTEAQSLNPPSTELWKVIYERGYEV